MSPQVTKMCEAILALTEQHTTFTSAQLHTYMGATNAAKRTNLTARLKRLVRNEVVRLANEQAAAGGAPEQFCATPAIVPYMNGDREGFTNAREATPQPALCDVWGIQLPTNFHIKRYPHARIYKQSWS